MKKNVISRSLAVIASAAVLSVASAFSASAAGESYVIGDATGKAGETVTINVSVSNCNLVAFGSTVAYDSALTYVSGAKTTTASGATVDIEGVAAGVNILGYADAAAPITGDLCALQFTIPADAEAGTTYDLTFSRIDEFVNGDTDVAGTVTQVAGTITVVADETEATTEAPTEAPTAAATTVATEAATTKAATTVAKKTASPKTGSAGVAVAVAGLVTAAATAVVLKSRKD